MHTMIIDIDRIKKTLEDYMSTSGTDLTAPGTLEKLVGTIFDLAREAYYDGRDDATSEAYADFNEELGKLAYMFRDA